MKILTNLIANKDCLGDYCDREKLNNFFDLLLTTLIGGIISYYLTNLTTRLKG